MYNFDIVELNTTDITYASIDIPGEAVNLMASSGDTLTFSFDKPFDGIFFQLNATNNYSGLVWEYLIDEDEDESSSWKRLPLIKNYTFQETGVVRFRVPNDWERFSGYYKARVRITSDAEETATLFRCFPFPGYAYTSVKDVERLIQIRKKNGITDTTNPSISDVERIIMRYEGEVEGYSTQTWKPRYIENEDHEYNRYGIVLRRYPVVELLRLEIFQGNEYRILMEGQNEDYILDKESGRVVFPRISSLPFTYNRSRHFGIGRYSLPLRATYLWGKDIDFDEKGGIVRNIVTHFTAAEILRSYDYTALIAEGTDRYGIESRIHDWEENARERLEELRPLRMFL